MRITRGIPILFQIVWAAAVVTACAGSGPGGPSFEVSFDPATPRSARDRALRVEVYLVDSCANVTLGTRPVPAVASTFVLRGGEGGAFGDVLENGDYGLYGVAQDADCAVVAAGCAPVTITGAQDTLAVTLRTFESGGMSGRAGLLYGDRATASTAPEGPEALEGRSMPDSSCSTHSTRAVVPRSPTNPARSPNTT